MYVDHYEATGSAEGNTIRGVDKFAISARPILDLPNAKFTIPAVAGGVHPQDDPTRRDPWIDIQDTQIAFEFFAPRIGSPIIAAAAGIPAPAQNVFNVIDALPIDVPVSDYPAAQFTLDMLLTTVVLRPPMLKGATLRTDGLLEPDPAHPIVSFSLPRLRMQLSQDVTGMLAFNLLSVGASSLDDGGDLATVELITMDPPYAFIGDSRIVGFGFRSAILDLSNGTTPPEVLEQFGYDENWTGLYLPVVRLFIAPNGMNDFAISAGASNLLIGLGNTPGITGDFALSVINQGAVLEVSARFYGPRNQPFGITRTGTTATAMLPQKTRMVVDASGRRPPYVYSATLNGTALTPTAGQPNIFDVDLGGGNAGVIALKVTDGATPVTPATLTINAGPRSGSILPIGPSVAAATLVTDTITRDGTAVGTPALRVLNRTDANITLTLDPPNATTVWEVRKPAAAPPDLSTGESVTIALAPNESTTVMATTQAVGAGPETVSAYFHFDLPNNLVLPEHDPSTVIDHVAGLLGTLAATPNPYSLDPENSNTAPAVTAAAKSPFTGQTQVIIDRMTAHKGLRLVVALPRETDFAQSPPPMNFETFVQQALAARKALVAKFPAAISDRLAVFHPVGFPGRYTAIRSSVVVVDDVYALVGTSHFRRRGMTFDGAADLVSFDRVIDEGYSQKIRNFRRALMATRLGIPVTASPVSASARWVAIEHPRSAFSVVRNMLDEGGLGNIKPLWEGDNPDVLPASLDAADPDGVDGSTLLSTLASFLSKA